MQQWKVGDCGQRQLCEGHSGFWCGGYDDQKLPREMQQQVLTGCNGLPDGQDMEASSKAAPAVFWAEHSLEGRVQDF